MSEQNKRNPYMDYRNIVPFVNLSGFIVRQPNALEEKPALTLQEQLMKKKFSTCVNFRRMLYCKMAEGYRNGNR